ncbi:hypothetical protein GQ600_18894 [Phytophthora cactorum]|nr:hypothetical protein GQ600_18894 [Phytophthora cactorum]
MNSSRSSSSVSSTRSLQLQQPMTIGQKYSGSSRHNHYYPARSLRQRSCLREESAFACGGASRGSRLDELSTTKMITVSYSAAPKKTLSFADQRGQHLVLEREFCRRTPPYATPTCRFDMWIEETLARQHLLSMCVVSLLGCALIGLRQTAK